METIELKYSGTNTYLIKGEKGLILFDTGWAGTLPAFCRALGDVNVRVQDIDHIIISHFHPDHMGIAQDIADLGPSVVIADIQSKYIHSSDHIFEKDKTTRFKPIKDENIICISIDESRSFLEKLGIYGELIHTPGHSDDSISLWLDEGSLFVGDLNPLYELELHKGTRTGASWDRLLKLNPGTVYYGHALTAHLKGPDDPVPLKSDDASSADDPSRDIFLLVEKIMKFSDKGYSLDKIQKKTGADRGFIEDVIRMYLTHQNVGVRGILDRIEIKNR